MIRIELQTDMSADFSLHSKRAEKGLWLTHSRFTQAQAIDLKLKDALRRARSLALRSPTWTVDFAHLDEC